MKNIAIVILNWNGRALLEKFLPSVINHSKEATIYVADNCSTDDSIEFVRSRFPEVNVILNSNNYGFAGGYNHALASLNEDFFVLLNSDVEVKQGWLSPLVSVLQEDHTIACCQPKIKNFNQKAYFEYAGAAGGFIDQFGYPFCHGRIFSHLEKDEQQYELPEEIFWASGACMLIRRKAFLEVKGFDEDFFAHMEEIDLCWRLKNLGYKVYYCPQSTIYHVGGGTLSKGSPWKTYLNFRNNFFMLCKNLHKKDIPYVLFTRLLLDGIAGLKFLLELSPRHTLAIIKAHFYCYLHIRELRQKRSQVGEKKQLRQLTGVLMQSIIWEYYIKKRKKIHHH